MTAEATPPLHGVRVLELSQGQAGRTAGMLLADLGADVVRVVPAGWGPADPASSPGLEDLAWDRGKRFVSGPDEAALRHLALSADILLDDSPAGALPLAGLDSQSLLAASPTLVYIAMPPYGPAGRWRDLPADPLLLSALGGFAVYHPSYEAGSPIASAVPMLTVVHGALGAAAAAAGLLGARTTGHGRSLEVSGLHASAACLATLVTAGIDNPIIMPEGGLPSRPNFRTYRCSDGRWMHLSALTAGFFLPALAALDRMDVMVMPGVDGEFTNIMRPEITRMVGRELEGTFAQRPRDEWLAILADAGVPAAPVCSREEWLQGEILATAAPPVTLPHPQAGPVVLPGTPIAFSGTPARIGPLPTAGRLAPAGELWDAPRPHASPAGPAPALPLSGLRVIDLSTFLAAPFASTLLAELGATVIKVEAPRGDPYSVFATSYAAVNHAKTVASADLRTPAGLAALLEIAGEADVLIDNLRPAAAGHLGLTDDVLAGAAPRAVRCSVSAFGRSGPFAELPGFDPVLQCRSGIAAAQGGDDEPVNTAAPTVDVGTGALTALGALAALVAREQTGRGQQVATSLAATATFLQVKELALYPARPPAETGGRDYRGPQPARRYHRAADGWLALAAATDSQAGAVAGLLGIGTLTHEAVAEAIAAKPVEHWLAEFARLGVPACTVPSRADLLRDPYLAENDFTHVVRDPVYGRFLLVRGYMRPVYPPPLIPASAASLAAARWPSAIERLESAGAVHDGYQVVPDEVLPR
jgi:crotonobetainyl-CoA:carnitine CoA-transferase CaiB-like acyl-CoA transferase